MIDASAVKQAFKDATDDEARELFQWVTTCMEVRGLIPLAGAVPMRKRRVDAGVRRKAAELLESAPNAAQPTVESIRERIGHTQGIAESVNRGGTASLSGSPNEMGVEK